MLASRTCVRASSWARAHVSTRRTRNASSQYPEVSIVSAVSAAAMERALGRAKVCGGRACGEAAGRIGARVCVLRVQEEGGNRL